MDCVDPGHMYILEDGQMIEFIKRENGKLIHPGTTNEELLEVLLDRMEHLNGKFPCFENARAIDNMQAALKWLHSRTKKRVEQGVETQDKPHVS